MSAVELQRAANRLREPMRCNTNKHDPAVADWLDEEAARVYAAIGSGSDARITEPALRTARLILGSPL